MRLREAADAWMASGRETFVTVEMAQFYIAIHAALPQIDALLKAKDAEIERLKVASGKPIIDSVRRVVSDEGLNMKESAIERIALAAGIAAFELHQGREIELEARATHAESALAKLSRPMPEQRVKDLEAEHKLNANDGVARTTVFDLLLDLRDLRAWAAEITNSSDEVELVPGGDVGDYMSPDSINDMLEKHSMSEHLAPANASGSTIRDKTDEFDLANKRVAMQKTDGGFEMVDVPGSTETELLKRYRLSLVRGNTFGSHQNDEEIARVDEALTRRAPSPSDAVADPAGWQYSFGESWESIPGGLSPDIYRREGYKVRPVYATPPKSEPDRAIIDKTVRLPNDTPSYVTQESYDGLCEQIQNHCDFASALMQGMSIPNDLLNWLAVAEWIVQHHTPEPTTAWPTEVTGFLDDLCQCDGSQSNVASAEVLASRIRAGAKEARAALSAIAAPQASGWNFDMSAAPRDGTGVLVIEQYARAPRVGFFDTARGNIWSFWPGRQKASPIAWMPLPAPPAREAGR